MRAIKLVLLTLILFTNSSFGQENDVKAISSNEEGTPLVLPQIQVVPIKDSRTARNYELYIELPEDYSEDENKTYPVLYYTDAMWHLEMLSGAAEYMLEDVILVGISWQKDIAEDLNEQYGAHASRFTDYSFWEKSNPNHPKLKFGQAKNHLAFIRNEVMQYVEKNYHTDPNSHSYFGYSLSGAFGAYILLTKPDTFDSYILGSPLDKGLIPYLTEINSKLEASKSHKNIPLHANVFIAHGTLEKDTAEPIDEFLKLFDGRKNLSLSVQNKTLEGDHDTAFPRVAVQSVAWLSSMMSPISSKNPEVSFWDIPHLNKPFISTTPEDRKDGILVDTLSVDSNDINEILSLSQEIFRGKYGNYDALLISHKNKLVFESYYKKGRVNLPHGQASAVKAYTSLVLGRAIQMGYLSIEDLDKPLIRFLKDVNPEKLTKGAEKITLHKALTMQGGLTIDSDKWKEIELDSLRLKGQGLVQTLLEQSEPITNESQTYLYGNFNPMLVMTVIDAVVPGTAQDFIKTELLDKLDITNFEWSNHISGLPEAGWRVSIMSRDMLKLGNLVLNKGKLDGEQLISAAYLAKATSGIVKPTQDWMPKDYRYGYFWYQTPVKVNDKSYDAAFAWGGGGQRVIVIEELDLTMVISGHDGEDDKIMNKISEIIIPAFVKQ
ncbi:serine hydrolase [Maribacter algarum]|uniref:Serine hydrolase n=1 Tax=Maribacter algarum (ex Zhang et al. 2020) TaxID=2578118 RepID=A0A5S3PRJ8_9FLAO|nr:serine hydrolase [Maribacter algarum]TMM57291.1 serine hydrolase [Maribacter algarum]